MASLFQDILFWGIPQYFSDIWLERQAGSSRLSQFGINRFNIHLQKGLLTKPTEQKTTVLRLECQSNRAKSDMTIKIKLLNFDAAQVE